MHIISTLASNHKGFNITPIAKAFSALADRVHQVVIQFFELISPSQNKRWEDLQYIIKPIEYSSIHWQIHENLLKAVFDAGLDTAIQSLGAGGFGGVYLMEGSPDIKVTSDDKIPNLALKILKMNKILIESDKGNFYKEDDLIENKEGEAGALSFPKGEKNKLARAYGAFVWNQNSKDYDVSFVKSSEINNQKGFVIATVSRAQQGDLKSAIEMKEGMTLNEIKGYGKNIAVAISNLHNKGYIHRDIKPANILVKANGKGKDPYRIQLADFGLTRKPDEEGLVYKAGSLGYSAPEKKFNKKADWYSFGKTLLKMATNDTNAKADQIKDENLKDLLFNDQNGLLNTDPNKRMNEEDILNHPFLNKPPSTK